MARVCNSRVRQLTDKPEGEMFFENRFNRCCEKVKNPNKSYTDLYFYNKISMLIRSKRRVSIYAFALFFHSNRVIYTGLLQKNVSIS